MDPTRPTVRRATLDDLPTLKGLWEIARLPVLELERQLTEFQVVLRPDGVIVGAVALQVSGSQGLVHGEAFYAPAEADEVRQLVFERFQTLARSRGVARLWMCGTLAPFWTNLGFQPATPNDLRRLPAAFGQPHGFWSTLSLRDEAAVASVEREFELLQIEQRANLDRIRQQGMILRWIAGLIAFGFCGAAVWLLFKLTRLRQQRSRSP